MTAMFTLLDGGESLDLPEAQITMLVKQDAIYFCDEDDCGFYHIASDLEDGWQEIDRLLGKATA